MFGLFEEQLDDPCDHGGGQKMFSPHNVDHITTIYMNKFPADPHHFSCDSIYAAREIY